MQNPNQQYKFNEGELMCGRWSILASKEGNDWVVSIALRDGGYDPVWFSTGHPGMFSALTRAVEALAYGEVPSPE